MTKKRERSGAGGIRQDVPAPRGTVRGAENIAPATPNEQCAPCAAASGERYPCRDRRVAGRDGQSEPRSWRRPGAFRTHRGELTRSARPARRRTIPRTHHDERPPGGSDPPTPPWSRGDGEGKIYCCCCPQRCALGWGDCDRHPLWVGKPWASLRLPPQRDRPVGARGRRTRLGAHAAGWIAIRETPRARADRRRGCGTGVLQHHHPPPGGAP